MDYKQETINDLRHHHRHKQACESIKEKILLLEEDYGRLRAVQSDRVPVSGGGSRHEDYLISNLAEREKLRQHLRILRWRVRWLENGLETLSREERMILEYFYINRPEDHVGQLCEELHLENAQVYRRKDQALESLAQSLYGI